MGVLMSALGWECPVCHRGVAPSEKICPECPARPSELDKLQKILDEMRNTPCPGPHYPPLPVYPHPLGPWYAPRHPLPGDIIWTGDHIIWTGDHT